MAKDYFQDITPPSSSPNPVSIRTPRTPPPAPSPDTGVKAPPPAGERSIRNIQVTSKPRPRIGAEDRNVPPPERTEGERSNLWLWAGAGVSLVVLISIGLVAFRSTTVTVVPRSHAIVFDDTAHFTAYPSATATPGTLSYTVVSSDLEDSEVVPSSGTVHAEDRASGTITIYNSYSTASVKLIKNTRFQSPDGLIFRVPADAVIPGKKGNTPGQIAVTVIADAAGAQYNIGPVARFTVPGLKSNAAMYAGVYARSTAAMSGGFTGDRAGVAPGALEAATAAVRSRLEKKAHDSTPSGDTSGTVLSSLIRITYESLPQTNEAGGGVRIHERAHVEVPVFPADAFAGMVAQSVGADAQGSTLTLQGLGKVTAKADATSSPLAGSPLNFTLNGTAMLVWSVDTKALGIALAGRDETSFETIVKAFPSIQEAHARIEPFWKKSFPLDPSAIKIKVGEPAPAASS